VKRKLKIMLVSLGILLFILWHISLVIGFFAMTCDQSAKGANPLWLITIAPIVFVMAITAVYGIIVLPYLFFRWLWQTAASIVGEK
jgi:hypothetical protein